MRPTVLPTPTRISHRRYHALIRWSVLIAFAACPVADAEDLATRPVSELPLEVEDDPPIAIVEGAQPTRTASVITYGRFTHRQVNVKPGGLDAIGDAANEPSIAVHPINHNQIAVGWRQFDTIMSNFRQAGFGYSNDWGTTWVMSVIHPGEFRSDPVLGTDAGGKFWYNSLSDPGAFRTDFFPSVDAGYTWGPPVYGWGGDKAWFTVDRTASVGAGNIYQAWSTASNPWAPNTFNSSIDDGVSFSAPSSILPAPVWGTLDVAKDGTLYVIGQSADVVYVARSSDARSVSGPPTWAIAVVDLQGHVVMGGPNPAGLLGQHWIGVDHSEGPRKGWIYALSSVQVDGGPDPMDVHFVRSTDGGVTWSSPRRINDDPGDNHWQWFGTMSVAPDGRIDAVWNDTRFGSDAYHSQLFYSYSADGGFTWSPNEAASPIWDSGVGWPMQNKIGDYYHMVSDLTGASLVWAATFNGGQDVYYCRIPRSVTGVPEAVAGEFQLFPNVPNPFTSSTEIYFEVPAGGTQVKLEVFDPAGRRVATLVDGFRVGGAQSAKWNGVDASGAAVGAGVYFCRFEAGGQAQTRKLMLLR